MYDNKPPLTIGSLFTGYGGIEEGIRCAEVGRDIRTVFNVEIEAFACQNLVEKMEENLLDSAPIFTDINSFNGKPFYGLVDILCGGFPCQPWSVAGKQKGTADERWLWYEIERIIKEIKPSICFFENVPGLVKGGGLHHVLNTFAKIGYDAVWGNYRASDIGAPHKRERIFILAVDNPDSKFRNQRINARFEERSGRTSPKRTMDIRNADSNREELGDSNNQGLQRHGESEEYQNQFLIRSGSERPYIHRFPARPGQKQFDWEPPRVVTTKKGAEVLNPDWVETLMGIPQGWTKLKDVDVDDQRVDRLRLCGNGVVPQQAALAWKDLGKRIYDS